MSARRFAAIAACFAILLSAGCADAPEESKGGSADAPRAMQRMAEMQAPADKGGAAKMDAAGSVTAAAPINNNSPEAKQAGGTSVDPSIAYPGAGRSSTDAMRSFGSGGRGGASMGGMARSQ